jgi:ornithine carbamoyltransferase
MMTHDNSTTKHFIDLDILESKELKSMILAAKKLKLIDSKSHAKLLESKNLAMIFDKNSTRTRVSFEAGINQLGGHGLVMDMSSTQLGKGESVHDTAKVLSGLVDMIMIRCKDHEFLKELAQNASIPIINGLTDFSHPCQIMSSILTIEENLGDIEGKKLAWFGDANNVLNSYIHAAVKFDYELAIAVPENFDFCNDEIKKAQDLNAKITLTHNSEAAAKNSDVLITDTWFSMGDVSEEDQKQRDIKLELLKPFQVTEKLMSLAKQSAIFTHCLPAYRGFEVTQGVIDSKQSVVFQEAHNRLHAQQAIMLWLNDVEI